MARDGGHGWMTRAGDTGEPERCHREPAARGKAVGAHGEGLTESPKVVAPAKTLAY